MLPIKTAAAMLLLVGSANAADPVVTYSAAPAERVMVSACHEAIAQWAAQFDPIDVETSIIGPVQAQGRGDRMATLFVEIVYARQGGPEPRSATIDCTMDAGGAIAVAEAS